MKFNSKEYWEDRYKKGGNSGNGSYGKVANEKTRFISNFIKENNIKSMVEYGCGDGNNLKLLSDDNPNLIITGVDVSKSAIKICKSKLPNHFFFTTSEFKPSKADLIVSLEVIFHLVEDHIYEEYMDSLTSTGSEWLIILSPNIDESHKNDRYTRKRKYTNSIYLKGRYNLISEIDFNRSGNKDCFSDWKIYNIK